MNDSGECSPRNHSASLHTYLSSTFAPAFSSWALTFSASSLLTPSLTGLGAPSTRSLASLRPRPVSARTSLMTSIFLSPIAASTTVNSVFSSTGAAAAAAGPAATATAAAAETPHFSSRSLASSAASRTVSSLRESTSFDRSAIVSVLVGSNQNCEFRSALRGFALAGIGLDHARDLGGRSGDDLGDLGGRGLDQADQSGAQFVERRQRGECLDAVRVQAGLAHRPTEDHETVVTLGKVDGDLGRRHRVARIGDHGRPLEQGHDGGDVRAIESDLGEAVFRDLHAGARLLHLPSQSLHLGHREAGIVSD